MSHKWIAGIGIKPLGKRTASGKRRWKREISLNSKWPALVEMGRLSNAWRTRKIGRRTSINWLLSGRTYLPSRETTDGCPWCCSGKGSVIVVEYSEGQGFGPRLLRIMNLSRVCELPPWKLDEKFSAFKHISLYMKKIKSKLLLKTKCWDFEESKSM